MAIFVWEVELPKGGLLRAITLKRRAWRLRSHVYVSSEYAHPEPRKRKGKGFDKEISIPGFGDKVTTKDISVATRQLATMIDAGLPIVQCLDILAEQSESKLLRNTMEPSERTLKVAAHLPTLFENIQNF